MGKVIMSGIVPQLAAPSKGIALADIAEGSIVKLNENGSPVEFYVAKHNYESGLNGSGKTLLVRKACYNQKMAWSSKQNQFYTSDIKAWLNGTYLGMLDAEVQTAIGTTSVYCTQGGGANRVTTYSLPVFMLSMTELGFSATYANAEGSLLPTATLLRSVAVHNDLTTRRWTRTPSTYDSVKVWIVSDDDNTSTSNCTDAQYNARPCFTLPATTMFDEKTLLFKGVS